MSGSDYKQEWLDAGADGFIKKPLGFFGDLDGTISKAVEEHNL